MRLTINQKLVFSAYIQLAVYGTLVFGSLLLFLTLGLSPLSGADFIGQAGSILTAVLLGAGLFGTLNAWGRAARVAGAAQIVLSSWSVSSSAFTILPTLSSMAATASVCCLTQKSSDFPL